MFKKLKNKKILITGCCGSIGNELIETLINNKKYSPKEIIAIDNNESALFFLEQKYLNYRNISFSILDIRDYYGLLDLMKNVDTVFHLAALKHVIINERSPNQSIQTNILGVQNIISAASVNNIENVIFTSSDKAVNPTSVMGTTKLMGEKLITASNLRIKSLKTKFFSLRFGNVIGSSGSVIPIFHKQIMNGGPVTITDNQMTRFFMSLSECVKMIIDTCEIARGGEVFVTKMPAARIIDIAEVMIEELCQNYNIKKSNIKIKKIGIKAGEKLYEELISEEEIRRTIELKNYYCIIPAYKSIYNNIKYEYKNVVSKKIKKRLISESEKLLSKESIRKQLYKNNIFKTQFDIFPKRYWPGDKEEKN